MLQHVGPDELFASLQATTKRSDLLRAKLYGSYQNLLWTQLHDRAALSDCTKAVRNELKFEGSWANAVRLFNKIFGELDTTARLDRATGDFVQKMLILMIRRAPSGDSALPYFNYLCNNRFNMRPGDRGYTCMVWSYRFQHDQAQHYYREACRLKLNSRVLDSVWHRVNLLASRNLPATAADASHAAPPAEGASDLSSQADRLSVSDSPTHSSTSGFVGEDEMFGDDDDDWDAASSNTFFSMATDLVPITGVRHYYKRVQERDIDPREVQEAKKYGTKERSGTAWSFVYKGLKVIAADDTPAGKCITCYRLQKLQLDFSAESLVLARDRGLNTDDLVGALSAGWAAETGSDGRVKPDQRCKWNDGRTFIIVEPAWGKSRYRSNIFVVWRQIDHLTAFNKLKSNIANADMCIQNPVFAMAMLYIDFIQTLAYLNEDFQLVMGQLHELRTGPLETAAAVRNDEEKFADFVRLSDNLSIMYTLLMHWAPTPAALSTVMAEDNTRLRDIELRGGIV
eukprot:TRINITY_DN8941_c0_g1_i1.p1 TRINITY_DN8941_c0_g1~~TRINITY_DN8941_c0_g1_i1.p1  ORF type:complete len:512 (+),score=136.57 TRINITY_DN8941_c0_g1_i1:243-1778(+)